MAVALHVEGSARNLKAASLFQAVKADTSGYSFAALDCAKEVSIKGINLDVSTLLEVIARNLPRPTITIN